MGNRSRLTVFVILAVSLVFGLLFAREMLNGNKLPRAEMTDRKLRILTYSTFVGPMGPGPEIFNTFKKQNNCDIDVVSVNDAGLLLERLKLAPASQPFDLVIGLDQYLLGEAAAQFQWKALSVANPGELHSEAVAFGTSPFIPYDWSPLGFIYRQGEVEPPREMKDLLKESYKGKIALQDPRASSPGLQFLNWVRDVQGAKTPEYLQALKPSVQSVSPSWSFSYGLFMKNQASLVFTYLTSLVYHWENEKDLRFQMASFKEGHPVQVEYAAVTANCRDCALAEALVLSLLDSQNQKIIMKRNFMFPVVKGIESTEEVFKKLPPLKTRATSNSMGKDLNDWDKVFKH